MTPEDKQRLRELETKFEALLAATNDVDLICAYALYKQEIHNSFQRIAKMLNNLPTYTTIAPPTVGEVMKKQGVGPAQKVL